LPLNYGSEIPHMIARLRAAYARHAGDPEWAEDIRRLAPTRVDARVLARCATSSPV
jgi:hypothetical protein